MILLYAKIDGYASLRLKLPLHGINVISDKSDQNLTSSGHNNGCWSPLNRTKASQVNL